MSQNPNALALMEPVSLPGGLKVPNRIVMAPMTRNRADLNGNPNELMATYYAQRAGAGLIISESTVVSPFGIGYLGAPGHYNGDQTLAWRKVTDAVHEKGGHIFQQLNHYGRCSSRFMLPGGVIPIAPSAVSIHRKSRAVTIASPRVTPYDTPRAMETHEAELVVQDFRSATVRAAAAGFDGVEIHADSGYLIHQFLSSNVNQRIDKYGGSVENRARFVLDVVDACVSVRGDGFVSVKLTPGWGFHDIEEKDAPALYAHVIEQLNRFELTFLHLFDSDRLQGELFRQVREQYDGIVLAEGSLSVDESAAAIKSGLCDMSAFGRLYISNPDLAQRIASGASLTPFDADTFYTPGAEGYIDYPIHEA
ncbi:MAG: alkene reductase [Pseudomonadales bacterium]